MAYNRFASMPAANIHHVLEHFLYEKLNIKYEMHRLKGKSGFNVFVWCVAVTIATLAVSMKCI